MQPGQRVRLIQQLAQSLEPTDWVDVDLVLRQFGFATTDNFHGSKYAYLVNSLEAGSDEELVSLHEQLFGFGGSEADVNVASWRPGMFRLFISHVSAEKDFAVELKTGLVDYGIDAFVAHEDIEPTKDWIVEIERALASCDALVADLTDGFHESSWTDQEVGFCHGRRVLIVSIRRGLDPYGFISRYQAIAMRGREPAAVIGELALILLRHERTSARMADAVVNAFEHSESFAEAKRRVTLLSEIERWTPELLRRLENAGSQNAQITESWGVPQQVDRILREHGGTVGTKR